MLPKLTPQENQYGESVRGFVPPAVPEVFGLDGLDREIWRLAAPHLQVRNNDAHTIYAYGLARALCDLESEANPDVVLPAILLHDTGWSRVPDDRVLAAIRPGGGDAEAVRMHEREGVKIAEGILRDLGVEELIIAEILDIIAHHDSMKAAKSLNDAVVKDADKLWRLSPHGIDTVMDWFGLDRDEASRLCASRVHEALHTVPAKSMARAFSAVASVDVLPERTRLG